MALYLLGDSTIVTRDTNVATAWARFAAWVSACEPEVRSAVRKSVNEWLEYRGHAAQQDARLEFEQVRMSHSPQMASACRITLKRRSTSVPGWCVVHGCEGLAA